ncbi:helix-turn-helix domain-containing protein [Butyrivibrio sp. AE3009]|uniref:helix-turn-helix domain-containing protein n=1 Tax=Butyrivibrio sp. AE3009 TaxID=1280666 RepID=UPI0003B64653|nr:helix-turn-helix transcriptional regulator [Butyrivibrio sp. AE3009]
MNNLGSKIKELRIAENLTQERLAEELNVSFQSISRWENGISTPDISLIPVIARYFNVSTDYLFGLQDEEAEITKSEFEQKYLSFRKDGDLDRAYEVMLEARKMFPRDLHFCTNLAEIMDLFEGGNSAQVAVYTQQRFSEQIFSLCRRVVEESKDETDRSKALSMLCSYYMKAGNASAAMKIADSMTDIMHSKEVLLGEVLSGEDKKKQLQENILTMADYISDTLVKIAFQKEYGFTTSLTPEQKLEYVFAANTILTTVISDGNYLEYSRKLGWNYRRIAELYAMMNRKENAIEYLLKAEEMAGVYDSMDKTAQHKFTAAFCDLVESDMTNNGKNFAGTETEMLSYRLDELSGYFGDDEQFKALKKRIGGNKIDI